MGWHKPTAPPVRPSWEAAVRALYLRSRDMEVSEFEELLDVAIRGERPPHPELPIVLPFATELLG